MKNFITVTTKPAHYAMYTIPKLCSFDTSRGGPLAIKCTDAGYGTVKLTTYGLCTVYFNGKKIQMGDGDCYAIGEHIELGSILIIGNEGVNVAVDCTFGLTSARWTEEEPKKFTESLQQIDF